MKKYLFFATALAALASCTSNDFVGEDTSSTTNQSEQAAIAFGTGVNSITRADHVGADAADLLGGNFYVAGFKNDGTDKNDGSDYTTVFDHYLLEWTANSAGTTTDNTSDWKYVGLDALGLTGHISGTQTIKYWDYSASFYNFVAFSAGKGNSITKTSPVASTNILPTAVIPATLKSAAYTLQGSATDLANCYIADLVTAKPSGASTPDINYQDEVSITFRRLGAKVRVALYETIPGYSVRDVKFYQDPSTTTIATGASETKATLFTSSDVFYPDGTMTVYFPTIGTANRTKTDYNKAHVSFAGGTGTPTSKQEFGALNYEGDNTKWEDSRLNYTGNTNTYLKRTSSDPSFAGTDPYYLTVLPDEDGNVLELRVDYTLESIDGSKEAIVVHGATAFVPQIYAQWKPNYAYTYIFKISDGTNGWTSKVSTDPVGLYPITFDAIVVDSEEHTQSTITTVSSPSITTYQKGHNYKDDGPEYKVASDSIYIQVMKDGTTLANDLNTKGALYTVTGTNIAKVTEADVMDALNIRTSGDATTIVGRNGFTLTPLATAQLSTGNTTFGNIPGADGNPIPNIAANTAVRFPATAGTYAYIYDTGTDNPDTEINSAVTLSAAPSDWATTYSKYYTNEACTITAPETFPTLTEGQTVTYYQKYTNLNKVYAVKVIRVVAAPVTPGSGS